MTEIQPSVEDVSCHYLYLWPTNHNHKLYLPRSKIHPCQHYWYLFPPQRIQTSNRFKHIYVPGVSRFVLFPISSPNHGVLWQLLAHLRDSLSIICHHQSAVVQRRTGQIQSQQNKILYQVFTMSQTDISIPFFVRNSVRYNQSVGNKFVMLLLQWCNRRWWFVSGDFENWWGLLRSSTPPLLIFIIRIPSLLFEMWGRQRSKFVIRVWHLNLQTFPSFKRISNKWN